MMTPILTLGHQIIKTFPQKVHENRIWWRPNSFEQCFFFYFSGQCRPPRPRDHHVLQVMQEDCHNNPELHCSTSFCCSSCKKILLLSSIHYINFTNNFQNFDISASIFVHSASFNLHIWQTWYLAGSLFSFTILLYSNTWQKHSLQNGSEHSGWSSFQKWIDERVN